MKSKITLEFEYDFKDDLNNLIEELSGLGCNEIFDEEIDETKDWDDY